MRYTVGIEVRIWLVVIHAVHPACSIGSECVRLRGLTSDLTAIKIVLEHHQDATYVAELESPCGTTVSQTAVSVALLPA